MDNRIQGEDTNDSPLYRYTATVWVERSMDLVAEDDDALEHAVFSKLEAEGTPPDRVVRISTRRRPISWE